MHAGAGGYPHDMKEHEIVAAVAASAGIDDHELAERAVRATLTVLGSRLSGGQAANVASQLPAPLAEAMPSEAPGERFDLTEFYRRVADAERGTPDQARRHARAVLAALKAGLTGHEYDHLTAQLPADYADLLGTEPVHHH